MNKIVEALRKLVKAAERDIDTRKCSRGTLLAMNLARAALAAHDAQPAAQQGRKPMFADLIGEDHARIEEIAAQQERKP